MVNLQADASLSVAAAGLTSGLPYVLPWFLDTSTQNLNVAELNVIGTAMRADVQLDTTATLTAEAIRNAMVDSTMVVTATVPTSDLGRTAQVDATLAVSASSLESAPVAYDATGTGADSGAGTTTSLSWTHTATAGADVFAFVLRGGATVAVTHDGVAMTYVTAISLNNDPANGTLFVFRRANAPGGSKTIAVTFGSATYASANSVSYLNVGSIKLSAAYAGAALTASQTISGADKGIIISAQGQYCGGVDTFVSSSGGTQRYQGMGSAKYMNLVVQDSTSTGSVAFGSTVTATNTVSGGVGLVLTPPPPTSTKVKTIELLSTVSANTGLAYSLSWNHTIESNATILVVAAEWLSQNWNANCTVNGQAMTRAGAPAYVNSGGWVGAVEFFYYVNPPAGTQSLVYNGGGTGAYLSVTSFTFTNAKAVGTYASSANAPLSVSGGGPNDFILNAIGGWVNGWAGFTGYNQTFVSADLTSTTEPGLFGYARGSSATFSVANLLANYGGYGLAALPIKPMIDAQGDTSLAATATVNSVGYLARQTDSTMAITASIPANSVRTAQIDVTQTVTASRSGSHLVDLHGNAPLAITATSNGDSLRNANVDVAQTITASRTSNVTWTTTADVAQTITASLTSIGSYGAVAAVAQTITATRPDTITWQLKANTTQAITATITADSLRNANVDVAQTITASRTANVTWALAANVAQTITATLQASELRLVNVDAALALTARQLAGAIYGATAATALPITATRLANVTWAAKAAALQQVTASPAAEYSRGQPASATQSITAIPDSTGSRGQTVESTETITVSTDAIGSRGQDIDSPLVVTADLLSMVTWQGWFDAAQVITASDTANAIWALRANAAQQITASYTALASYGATGNALLPITASPLLSNVIWDAQALSDLIVTASTPTIGSRWQPIDSTQAITALLSGIGSRGQFVDSTLGLTIAALPAAISYGATGNAPLVITVNLLTSDTLLDNHAYAALVVNAGRPTSVIWDTRADSRLTVTTHFWATFGRLLNVDANLTVVTRLTAALRAVFLSNASLGIVAGLPTKLSRWQPIDSTQAITATPAGGIVWHGRIAAPLRITASPVADSIWDAHAQAQLTITDSGLAVVSHGQDMDPALEITTDLTGEFIQTMDAEVEQAILALPDTGLSLGSTMDSALPLIVTYSADIGEALRGGNFFYFYL